MYLSVLMTTYNCGEYISQAIQSVLNQTYKNFELLIIDDGSNDDTESILKTFNDSRIRYIKIEHLGRSAALNYGLEISQNDWVALMDADDIAHPKRLELQLKNFDFKNDSISCTWCAYFFQRKISYLVQTPINNLILKQKMSLHSYICNQSVIFNKNLILFNGGYNEKLSNSEDYELWLRLLNKVNFFVVPEYLLFVRERYNSLSRINLLNTKQNIIKFLKDYSDLDGYFRIINPNDQKIIFGWREYFYGDRKKAREHWLKLSFKILLYPKVMLGFVFTYFTGKVFDWFWQKRFRLRINSSCKKIVYPSIRRNEKILIQFLCSN